MHDKNGKLLNIGDKVIVECVVENTYATENDGFCNITVKTVEPMFPTEHPTTITFNSKQVISQEESE
jgi:hypothetical protein